MKPFSDAKALLLQEAWARRSASRSCSSSAIASTGRTAAQNVAAPIDLPSFDNAAMDGYAVQSSALAHANYPLQLFVASSVAAGSAPEKELCDNSCSRSTHATAVEVMTGALMPEGYDSVVPLEAVQIVEGPPDASAGALRFTTSDG